MFNLIRSLIRPHRGTLLIILIAMLVQTAMSVAGPWPLKIILDNVVGSHKLSPEMTHLLGPLLRGEGKMKIGCGNRSRIDRPHWRNHVLHRELPHDQRRSVGGQRFASQDLSSPPATLAQLLRQP